MFFLPRFRHFKTLAQKTFASTSVSAGTSEQVCDGSSAGSIPVSTTSSLTSAVAGASSTIELPPGIVPDVGPIINLVSIETDGALEMTTVTRPSQVTSAVTEAVPASNTSESGVSGAALRQQDDASGEPVQYFVGKFGGAEIAAFDQVVKLVQKPNGNMFAADLFREWEILCARGDTQLR